MITVSWYGFFVTFGRLAGVRRLATDPRNSPAPEDRVSETHSMGLSRGISHTVSTGYSSSSDARCDDE